MSEEEDKKRPMGKNTMLTTAKRLQTEAELEEKRIAAELEAKKIAADLEAKRIALESKKIDNDSKKMDVDDKDRERDDKRTTLQTMFLGLRTVFAGLALLLALSIFGALGYNAMKTGSMFNFSGFGFSGGVGTPAESPTPPENPVIAPRPEGPEATP